MSSSGEDIKDRMAAVKDELSPDCSVSCESPSIFDEHLLLQWNLSQKLISMNLRARLDFVLPSS